MRKFQPIHNTPIACATDPGQAERIVNFLNKNAGEIGCTFYVNGCVICAARIKPTHIVYVQGIIAGHLLTK